LNYPEHSGPKWTLPHRLAKLNERNQRIAHDLLIGGKSLAVARKFGLSPAWVSQLRLHFDRDWQRFYGDIVSDVV
jgi:hypothetical protein